MATAEALSLNQPLTDFATAYDPSADSYIAHLVSPDIEVTAVSGTFEKRLRATGKATVSDTLSADGVANELGYTRDTDTFALIPRALKAYVNGVEDAAIVTSLSPEEEKLNVLMSEIMLNHEIRVAAVLENTSNYASGYQFAAGANSRPAAATLWSDWTNGDPIGDIKYMLRKLPSRVAGAKRVAWCSDAVYDALCEHPTVLARMGMDKGTIDKAVLLSLFRGLDDIVVTDLEKNTANEGQTASFSRVWSATKFGIVTVPAGKPSTKSQMFAGTFRHTDGVRVRTWRDEGRGYGGSTGMQVEHLSFGDGAKVIQNDAGILLTGVLA